MAQGWVSLLQRRLEQTGHAHHVVNASISGDTTANGLTRLETALKTYLPEIVIVELGGNDGLRAQPIPTIMEDLEKIIQKIQAMGAKVIIAGIRLPPNYGPVYVNQFEQLYPELARKYNAILAPFFMEGVAANPELMQADGIHPTAAAQPVLLDNIWPHLKLLLEPIERK